MSSSERQQHVLITGCSPGGIGHALALEFHSKGCHVIATTRNVDSLSGLADMGMSTLPLDVTDQYSINDAKREVMKITGGKLDILVNNAGRSHTFPSLDVDINDVRTTFETNVFGPMAMCTAFIDFLIPTRGLILNIGSISALMPYFFAGVYASSKASLVAYSRVLRMELLPFNVRVMVALTGTVRSNFANHEERTLSESSHYWPLNEWYQTRLTWNQENSSMPTPEYAAKVVEQALKGEATYGGWVGGTPNYFWVGGKSTIAWLCQFLPTDLMESFMARVWKMGEKTALINEAKSSAEAVKAHEAELKQKELQKKELKAE